MKLQRIHYNVENFTVSDEVLEVAPTSRVGQLFTQKALGSDAKLERVAFLRSDGEEIVWRRITTT